MPSFSENMPVRQVTPDPRFPNVKVPAVEEEDEYVGQKAVYAKRVLAAEKKKKEEDEAAEKERARLAEIQWKKDEQAAKDAKVAEDLWKRNLKRKPVARKGTARPALLEVRRSGLSLSLI